MCNVKDRLYFVNVSLSAIILVSELSVVVLSKHKGLGHLLIEAVKLQVHMLCKCLYDCMTFF